MMHSLHCGLVIALSLTLIACAEPKHNYRPSAGYVRDEVTAIKIAIAVWEPIYGAKQLAREKPFTAMLRKGVWIVEGSLPENALGGVAVAEISRKDGRIIRVSHGE